MFQGNQIDQIEMLQNLIQNSSIPPSPIPLFQSSQVPLPPLSITPLQIPSSVPVISTVSFSQYAFSASAAIPPSTPQSVVPPSLPILSQPSVLPSRSVNVNIPPNIIPHLPYYTYFTSATPQCPQPQNFTSATPQCPQPQQYSDEFIQQVIIQTHFDQKRRTQVKEKVENASTLELTSLFVDFLLGNIQCNETGAALYKKARDINKEDPSKSPHQLLSLARTFIATHCKKFAEIEDYPVKKLATKVSTLIQDGEVESDVFYECLEQIAALTPSERVMFQKNLKPQETEAGKTWSRNVREQFCDPLQTVLDQYRYCESVPLNLQGWLQQTCDQIQKLRKISTYIPQYHKSDASEIIGNICSLLAILGVALGQVAPDTRKVLSFNNWGGLVSNYTRSALESRVPDRFRMSQSALQKAKSLTIKSRAKPKTPFNSDAKQFRRPETMDK